MQSTYLNISKMKTPLFIIFLLIGTVLFSQKIIYKDFKSVELNQTRTLKIFIPESYEKDQSRLYPLAILFDGDFLFDVYTGNATLFAQRDKAPEQIIVGILQNKNKERYKDCEYDKINGMPTQESDLFYRFVRMELLDYLESNYRLSPFRTLIGSTLTANFVNYFVVENEIAFDAFVCINPYYNPDMTSFLNNKLSEFSNQKIYYYLNSGNYNSPGKHERIDGVANLLQSLNNQNIIVKYDQFNTSTKISSIGQAIPAAIAHIFNIYSAISKEEFALNIEHLSPPDAIAYLENKYVEIEYLFGTNIKIRERDIYAIESIIIDQEEGEYLISFGEMIQKLYPETPISDYYIGQYYEKREYYKKALKHYKNGYAKIDGNSDDAEAYYKNIERVLKREEEIKEIEKLEQEQKKAEKELHKIEKEEEKEARKAKKEEERKREAAEKELMEIEYQKDKEARRIQKESEKKQSEAEKELRRIEYEEAKETKKARKEEERKLKEEQEKLKKEAWENRKKAEKEMRDRYRKKDD
jgi:hypothetical protein